MSGGRKVGAEDEGRELQWSALVKMLLTNKPIHKHLKKGKTEDPLSSGVGESLGGNSVINARICHKNDSLAIYGGSP